MLTLALPVVVAALVGGVPGTRQVAWQVAACALHVIMQVVTADVCAKRIFPAACAAAIPSIAAPTAITANTMIARRMPVERI